MIHNTLGKVLQSHWTNSQSFTFTMIKLIKSLYIPKHVIVQYYVHQFLFLAIKKLNYFPYINSIY